MQKKHLIYTSLLCLFISVNYVDLWHRLFNEFDATLMFATDAPIFLSLSQLWFFTTVGIGIDAIVIAIVVGMFAYFFRSFRMYVYLLFGILMRYSVVAVIVVPALAEQTPLLTPGEISWSIYVTLILQFLATILGSYFGYWYVKGQFINKKPILPAAEPILRHMYPDPLPDPRYLDVRDRDLHYLYGIPKKIWVLIIISFNPVIQFLFKFSIVYLYGFTDMVASRESWRNPLSAFVEGVLGGGFMALIFQLLLLLAAWALAAGVFSYGLKTIRNKQAGYRYLRIVSIFVLLPLLLLVIPLVRNRTWFF